MDIKHLLKDHGYQNVPLTFEEAYALGEFTVRVCKSGPAEDVEDLDAYIQSVAQSITVLSVLHNRATYAWRNGSSAHRCNGDTPPSAAAQIAGVCAAVLEEDVAKSEFGLARPQVPFAIDNCGMGGDLTVTANVSTIAALIAATAGIPMFKHGSPANADKGRHGSSDFIHLLGINPAVSKETMERCVERTCFGYIEALDRRYKHIHALTHDVAQLPHMNDIIGPITAPIAPDVLTRRVVGVNHLIPPIVVAEAYRILNERGIANLNHGFFVRGFTDSERYHDRGMDEVSICSGGTQVAELRKGEVFEYDLFASDFGLKEVPAESISPPDGVSKGEFSFRILRGEVEGPPLQMVLANAALLFRLAGRSESFRECYAMAEETFRSGRVFDKVAEVSEALMVPV